MALARLLAAAQFDFCEPKEALSLRKLGSKFQGHPHVLDLPWVETTTGSLGQGFSVALGMALGLKLQKNDARVYTLLGDGELQEGQFWESLPSAVHARLGEIVVIIDHNKIQSDTWVHAVNDLGDLEAKLRAFGWNVSRVDGNDLSALLAAFADARRVQGQPSAIVCDTLPGKGVPSVEAREKVHYVRPRDPRELDGLLAELEETATCR